MKGRGEVTTKDLLERLQFHVEHERYPKDVVIQISRPSVGALASVPVRSIGPGIDFDAGKFFIIPSEPLVTKTPKHSIFDDGFSLLYKLSGDRGRTGKLTRIALEVRELFEKHGVPPWYEPFYKDKDNA